MESADDTVLIQLISEAQTDAMQELFDRYSRLVFSVAFAILGDRSVAEEATLDVFVRVWRGAKTYRSDRAKVSTWLIALTRHHAIDLLRWQKSRPDAHNLSLDDFLSQYDPAIPNPETHVEKSLQREHIRAALAQLPPEQRQVLILAYFRGHSHQQIAEILKQPLGTIKTRIRLAMQKLRQLLSDEVPTPDTSEDT